MVELIGHVGASAHDEFWFSSWEVRLGLGWTLAGGVNVVATYIRSRNHIYIYIYSVLVK